MHWLTIAYSMTAAACVTLAAVHLLVWFKQPAGRAHLAFAMTAIFVAAATPIELSMVRAQTIGQFGTAIRWIHLPGALLTFSLVWFVWLHFRTGRLWLACAACGLRVLALILNFSFTPNLNYREITGLRQVALFGGESVSSSVGVVNPWSLIGQLSTLFLFLYMLDASVTLWRRGDRSARRRAVVVGGSMVFFILMVGGYVALILAGFIVSPVYLSFPFLAIVAAMGYELSLDVVKAGQLSLEVKANEERLSLAQEAGEIGAFDWDIPSGELRWTEKLESIYGLPPGGFGGTLESWRERVHPEDLDRCEAEINEALGQKLGDWQTQYRIVRAEDREIRWIDARGRLFFDAKAEPVRMLGVNTDITERRQAEEARNKLAAIVESSDHAILSKTLDGTITSWNAGAEKMYGYSANEMVGQHVSTLAPGDLKDEVAKILERIRRGDNVDHLETVRVTKDGRRIDVSLTISAIKDEHGTIIGASTIARDITARRRAELQMLQQRGELAHLSRVTMLGELSGSLAHELNQPLGAILRNTEAAELFLQDPSPDLEELKAILADIRKDDQRAGAVIDRMRSLVKRREIEHSLLDLNVLAREVISLVRPDADARKVRLALEPASSLPPVCGDRVQLQQVLLNLLLNAMDAVNDFAPDRRRVTVRVESVDTLVEVTVSDTGHGIPPDKFARLFEPFFTTKANGMGMGLPISRRIMEAHLGSIRAENDSSGGATFHFTLPVAKEESGS
jgi:two-component system sensor kinase FixL